MTDAALPTAGPSGPRRAAPRRRGLSPSRRLYRAARPYLYLAPALICFAVFHLVHFPRPRLVRSSSSR